MAKGASPHNVAFAHELVVSCREPRDDELSVMVHFSKHADRCVYCIDPYEAYIKDRPLCSRGLSYAKDVANYLYAKGGKPFSLIEKAKGKRVQVNVPAGCEAVSLLIKAFDKGMKLDSPRLVVIENTRRHETVEKQARVLSPSSPISPSRREREYPSEDRTRERRYVRDDYDVVEIIPHSSRRDRQERVVYHDDRTENRARYERRERPKSVAYTSGKGSLYVRDEEERRRRERYDRQPVVIVAEPGQRFTTRR